MNKRAAVSTLFLVHGLIDATWVSRIPAIQNQLHADTGALGVALLGSALGAILSMPLAGWLLTRHNSRMVTIGAVLAHCAALPLLGFANSPVMLLAALIVYGAAAGAADVSINAEGSAIDKKAARPVMSSFHALFSMGGMLGAAAGAVAVKWGVPVGLHLGTGSAVFALISICMLPGMGNAVPERHGPAFVLPPRHLLALGALAFCILFGERAMADWTGIYLAGAGATQAFAAYGFAIFSAAMMAGRFAGDWAIARFGAVEVVRTGSGLAAIGLALALAIGTPGAGLLGCAAVGLGFAAVVPILFRAGGQMEGVAPGLGIAAVTTLGYLGFLVGPPLVGFTARATSLRIALLIVAAMSAVVSISVRKAMR